MNKKNLLIFLIAIIFIFSGSIVFSEELYKFLYNLSKNISDRDLKIHYLERTLSVNPDFEQAKRELDALKKGTVLPEKEVEKIKMEVPREKSAVKIEEPEQLEPVVTKPEYNKRLDMLEKSVEEIKNKINNMDYSERITGLENKIIEMSDIIDSFKNWLKKIESNLNIQTNEVIGSINSLKGNLSDQIEEIKKIVSSIESRGMQVGSKKKKAMIEETTKQGPVEVEGVETEPAVPEEIFEAEPEAVPSDTDEEVYEAEPEVEVVEPVPEEEIVAPPLPEKNVSEKKTPPASAAKVNINNAPVSELTDKLGLGKLDSILIDRYRKRYGRIKGPEDLYKIPGITITQELLSKIEY